MICRYAWKPGLLVLSSLLIPGAASPARAAEAGGSATQRAGVTVAHRLDVELDPAGHRLTVDDRMLLLRGGPVEFLLNGRLEISASQPPIEEIPLGEVAPFFGNNGATPAPAAPAAPAALAAPAAPAGGAGTTGSDSARKLRRYRVQLPEGGGALHLTYSGQFDFGLGTQQEEYQRGFRETLGIVSPAGVYLAGNGTWYAQFSQPGAGDDLLEFELTARATGDETTGWHLLSQGNGESRDEAGRAHWSSGGPVDEIYLVGGPLVRYRRVSGGAAGVAGAAGASGDSGDSNMGPVEALVYLHEDDAALAAKYLGATAQYLEMYSRLIGPYPYGKFALVENFWETGYGMASFTLLGPQVLRMPFIVTSSFPHEILHNWWGNSVFVDYASGNWCEGLTAYMADHLMQEQNGRGGAYRRDILQNYASYVRDSRDLSEPSNQSGARDFPLTEFRSRHSAATEAVGYGKSQMGFHMLRRRFGDDLFRAWARRLYREERGQVTSFADLRRTFEEVAGAGSAAELKRFFHDWTERPGAAALAVEGAAVHPVDGGYRVTATLRQTQGGEPFALDIPVVIQTAGQTAGDAVVTTVHLEDAAVAFAIQVPKRPVALSVDPSFDLFRRLDPREIPASIGQVFGEPKLLAVIASRASAEEAAAWRSLMESWKSESHVVEVKTDAEVVELPADRAVWLLGRENRLAPRYFGSREAPGPAGLTVNADSVSVDGQRIAFAGHLAVLVVRHPASAERAIGWITVDPALLAALPGLGRKLPHYGKYSYLGFEGSEPTNMVKGQWATSDTPLRIDLRLLDSKTERMPPLPPLVLEPRRALAELPPVVAAPRD